MRGDLPGSDAMAQRLALCAEPKKIATRKASEAVLEAINAGRSRDDRRLGRPHRLQQHQGQGAGPADADDYAGRYIYYGIREFGMAAAMNGMALHGGVIPYGGTFLIFSDYCRPAIRLSALQQARVVYVMTHDSIGLGEDGPTHQPVEQLQSLRAMPNLHVFRPCDAGRDGRMLGAGAGAARRALGAGAEPQDLPPLRTGGENLCASGAYRLRAAAAERKVILLATGSEVSWRCRSPSARRAGDRRRRRLHAVRRAVRRAAGGLSRGHPARRVQPPDPARSIEAGTTIGWERYTGLHGLRFGIDRFGASGPAEDLYPSSASPPTRSCRHRPVRRRASWLTNRSSMNDQSCDQRFRAHRPPRRARLARQAG
jgi:transketolase